MSAVKYSDLLARWLLEAGYSRCFSVGGGNIMHLVNSVSRVIPVVPVVHEVAAGIAAEYFTETGAGQRAFALVTTGPGVTNIVTALAGAYLDSRELLVIAGQVKTTDLSHGRVRQRGIQEIEGVRLAEAVSKKSVRLNEPIGRSRFLALVAESRTPRKGPVFIELPLDVQGKMVLAEDLEDPPGVASLAVEALPRVSEEQLADLVRRLRHAARPMILLGGGVSRELAWRLGPGGLSRLGVPIVTTWNGTDRIGADHPLYFGRPNTWGQRYANLLLQQSDVLLALGTRLGIQQSGFNWQQFVPLGEVVQVDVDQAELDKGHPRISQGLCADADDLLERLTAQDLGEHSEWIEFCREVKAELPLVEPGVNVTAEGCVSPYAFYERLSCLCRNDDVMIVCSSGGAITCGYQTFRQKTGQPYVTNKGLASMGYGLSGAIGAALANPAKRTILVEGDGGFAQNIQEIGTAAINGLNLKMFVFDDGGYASIRMTQRSYFGGHYVGCDTATGLGLPDWEKLFAAYGVPVMRLRAGYEESAEFLRAFDEPGIQAFVVTIDPDQTYFPKITSRVRPDGGMESNPLHRMTPDLAEEQYRRVARYLVEFEASKRA